MHDDLWRRFMVLTRDLDPDTRAIVRDQVRRLVSLDEVVRTIERRRH